MNSGFLFALLVFLMAFGYSVWSLGGISSAWKYLKAPENILIRLGIILFIGAGIVVGLMFGFVGKAHGDELNDKSIKWFQYGELYLGIERPFLEDSSPQCQNNGPDNKTTSNGGLRINILGDGRTNLNLKYTHHSCAFNEDQNLYDAIGVETTFRLW